MEHFIYRTVHKNGKYYIGRHSTHDINDGYIGSGRWPLSIKNKSDVTREILEWANSVDELIELEGRYLAEHYGRPECMNMTPNPLGFDSEHHPMKDPEVAAKIAGENHWSRKNPEKIVKGDEHWLRQNTEAREAFLENHPNKDGRNAKLAMERGTHINLGENNPSKQRSRKGIHQWQHGKSPNFDGKLNTQRVESGSHNWLGPESNQKRIDEGTHNFLGSSANERMLAEGKHPSQIKITCEHCGATSSKGMHVRWHGDNCKHKQK